MTPSGPAPGPALWNLGFRPFYLLASAFGAAAIVVWAAQLAGWIPAGAYLAGHLWHAHEMIFGYTVAVVAGFLLTAVRNWTGLPTPSGVPLACLAGLWVAGRVLVLMPWLLAAALVNAAFPICVGAAIAVPMVRSANRRNYFFAALLVFLGMAVLAFHLSLQGRVALPARLGLLAGLDMVLFVMAVMGGRVIPMFTNNGVPGTNARRTLATERLSLGGVLALLAADLAQAPEGVVGAVALVAALAHAARLWLWQPWRTVRTPLVWVLHAAYAWIVVHLALRSLAAFGVMGESLALHALTVGAIGGLTLGMMTRTARGHTGRSLEADGWETAAFALVMAAALVRVGGGIALPHALVPMATVSAALWSAAFAIYAVRYWPVLTRPRLDGKPG